MPAKMQLWPSLFFALEFCKPFTLKSTTMFRLLSMLTLMIAVAKNTTGYQLSLKQELHYAQKGELHLRVPMSLWKSSSTHTNASPHRLDKTPQRVPLINDQRSKILLPHPYKRKRTLRLPTKALRDPRRSNVLRNLKVSHTKILQIRHKLSRNFNPIPPILQPPPNSLLHKNLNLLPPPPHLGLEINVLENVTTLSNFFILRESEEERSELIYLEMSGDDRR